MDERIETLYNKHRKDLEDWFENLRYYQQTTLMPYNPLWEDVRKKPIDLVSLLHHLLEIFAGYGKFKGTWHLEETLDYRTGVMTGIFYEKIQHSYHLGIDKVNVFLRCSISHPESIHKMFDEFFREVAAFSKFGVFTHSETEIFDDAIEKARRRLLRKKMKGALAGLMRNYFVGLEELDGHFDLGFLEVQWPIPRFTMYQILAEGCQAFEIFHRLNVGLWKKTVKSKP